MAQSTLSRVHFGDWQAVSTTLPFTAPQDGIFYMRLSPSASAAKYLYLELTGGILVEVNSMNGMNATTCIPMVRGEQISLYSASSGISVTYRFRPLIGGGI